MRDDEFIPSRSHKSWDELLDASVRLYRQAFWPLVGAAFLGTLVSNILAETLSAEEFLPSFAVFLIPFIPAYIAGAAITIVAWQANQGHRAEATTGYLAALSIAPKYIAMNMLILVIVLGSMISVVAFPLGLILYARWAIAGPVMLLEQQGIAQSLRRSWHLVEKRVLRTLGLVIATEVAMFLVLYVLRAFLLPLGDNPGPVIITLTIAESLALPLVGVFFYLLFEDYRALAEEAGSGSRIPPSSVA